MTGRDHPGEQAVIVAFQAVANYPVPTDFVRAVQQRKPGIAALWQTPARPSGCTPPIESAPMEETSSAPVASSSEDPGRKRSPQEVTRSAVTAADAASSTSRPPLHKQRQEMPNTRSVVIAVPPETEQQGFSSTQASMNEPMQLHKPEPLHHLRLYR